MRLFGFLIFLFVAIAAPSVAHAAFDIDISFDLFAPPPVELAPPPLPVYVIPPPPVEDEVWMPGYWRWDGAEYFWVPGTWVEAPAPAVFWTPGYWGWRDNAFAWNEGYWGPHVGFYGGISYGGGYNGSGFNGGRWDGGHYAVNRSVVNVTNITNVTNVTNVSFNGGPGGTRAQPSAADERAAHEQHIAMTQAQIEHTRAAAGNSDLKVSANHGKPPVAATANAADFTHNVIAAKAAGARNEVAEQHNAQARQQHPNAAAPAVAQRPANGEGEVDKTQFQTPAPRNFREHRAPAAAPQPLPRETEAQPAVKPAEVKPVAPAPRETRARPAEPGNPPQAREKPEAAHPAPAAQKPPARAKEQKPAEQRPEQPKEEKPEDTDHHGEGR